MRLIFTIISLHYFCSIVLGQGVVSGKVFDGDSNALVGVPVYLLQQRDSSVIQVVQTDNEGCYCFEYVSKGIFFLKATMLGRNSPIKKIMIWKNLHITADLYVSESIELKEVEVVSTGITVSGDTTTYVVNRFTSGRERNLKEVLERLPNISVDENSKSVTANGRNVSRILLESQDLFQGNISIPLDNFSADGVRQVDVIDNYSEYNIYDGFKTTNETVLNVRVDDKSKNRIKGEIDAYGGILNKYNVRNSSFYIGKKSMLSSIMASNNMGTRLLAFQDIMQFSGGLNNFLSGENPMDELSSQIEIYSAFTNSRKDIFWRKNNMLSLNFVTNPTSKVKLSISGIYGYDHHNSHKENSYNYSSGLDYTEDTKENCLQHNGLLNLKLAYMPNKYLNIIYSSNMLVATQDKWSESVIEQSSISFQTMPKTLTVKNNLLLAKRFGKNLLNLSVDYSINPSKDFSTFKSTYNYYAQSLGLDNSYKYKYEYNNNMYATQLFYLHRISDYYYFRFALKGELDKQHFITQNIFLGLTDIYDNDSQIKYTTYYGDIQAGKDKGDFWLSLRLRYALHQASTDDIKRNFVQTRISDLFPMLQAKYQFTPFHYLMMNYEYSTKKNFISNLIDGKWLKSYNLLVYSNADNPFSFSHKVSLSHLLSLQYVGLNFINMVSYEKIKNPIISNYYQEGYVSIIEKRQDSCEKLFTLVSMAEYRLLHIPLNLRCNVNYNHTYTPIHYSGTPYKVSVNNLSLIFQLITFYKKGFNANLKWQIFNQEHKGAPIANRLTTSSYVGLFSWQNDKIYASVDVKLMTYNLNHTNTKNMYYGFEFRYEQTKNIMWKLCGVDIMHLNKRRQMTGNATSYYSLNSLTWYMPGHIIAGVSFKY